MSSFTPLRELPAKSPYGAKDLVVIFGEVFERGYVNGLIREAQKNQVPIIYGTVGRRNKDMELKPLSSDELQEKNQNPLINIPLEAGFDLEMSSQDRRPCDLFKQAKGPTWKTLKLPWEEMKECQEKAKEDFLLRLKAYIKELKNYIKPESRILFVHTMAGGVPRARIFLSIISQVFRGYADRYLSSQELWEETDLGQFCKLNFQEVTAETFKYLIEETSEIRKKNDVSYVAYGYHGTEILIGDKYTWQSYSPYLQGFAKLRLEEIAQENWAKDVRASVFNVPEILTNSSSAFLGIEVAIYPLLEALKKEVPEAYQTQEFFKKGQELLSSGHSLEEVLDFTKKYYLSEITQKWSDFEKWPQHNGPEQMQQMRELSKKILDMHKNPKEMLTSLLSELVFEACGKIIFHNSYNLSQPISWIGHKLVAQSLNHPY